jgi:hypothetical protein
MCMSKVMWAKASVGVRLLVVHGRGMISPDMLMGNRATERGAESGTICEVDEIHGLKQAVGV